MRYAKLSFVTFTFAGAVALVCYAIQAFSSLMRLVN